MSSNAKRLVAACITTASVILASLDPAALAQSVPSACAPNSGGSDCTALITAPYIYDQGGYPYYTSSDPAEAAWEAYWKQSVAGCSGSTFTLSGWISQPMCENGGCVGGIPTFWTTTGGGPYTYPANGPNGVEQANWLTYQVGGVQSYPSCNTTPPTKYEGTVYRQRDLFCVGGYDSQGSYCLAHAGELDRAKNLGPQCPTCGNPIAIASGNKFQRELDYQGSGDFPLKFERYYNSLAHNGDSENSYYGFYTFTFRFGKEALYLLPFTQKDTPFWANVGLDAIGANWRHSYQRAIVHVQATSGVDSAFAYRPDGRVFSFLNTGAGFVAPADVADQLTHLDTGSWQYRSAQDDELETYSSTGALLTIQNRAGQTQTLTYDSAGRLTEVTDPFGHALTFQYAAASTDPAAADRITGMTTPSGGAYTYAYGSSATLTTVTYPDNTQRTYQYGGNNGRALTGIVDEQGQQYATFGYDTTGLATLTQHGCGSAISNKFQLSYGRNYDYYTSPVAVTDAFNVQRTYNVSAIHGVAKITSITQPATSGLGSLQCTYAYDTNGNVVSRVDFSGNVTCYTYSLSRNLETIRVEGFAPGTSCPSNLSSYVPTPGTRQRKITTAWNANFRLPATITEATRTTSLNYDANGNLLTKTVTDTTVTPNISRTWTYTYDCYGRMLTADGPRTDVSDVTTYTYYTCTTGYQCGQVQTVTNAAGQVTTYNTYNAHGQPLTITDPNGVATTLTYDLRQRLTLRQVGSETTIFSYWPTGLLKQVTLPDGSYLLYTYDAAHRLTQINDAAGNKVIYTLDAMGNKTAENTYDPSSVLHRTHSRVINTLNQVYQDINAAGTAAVTTTFGYDANGNETSISAPLSRNTTNAYDELNRLKQTTDPASGITQFGYDAEDNLTSVKDPRSLTTSYSYNGFGELVNQGSPDTGTTINAYDSAGNLATSTDARGAISTYTYDALNRVTSVAYTLGSTADQTIAFTYDAGANGKGHLTSASDANHSMSCGYDGLGRVTSKSQTVTGVTKSAGYAYTNGDLTSLTTPSGQSVAYGYNANHQVTSVRVNGTTVLSGATYEPLGPVNGWTWGNGTTTTRSYDTDGKVSQIATAGTKTFSYDNAFRITAISDTSAGATNWTYGYDALDRITSGTSPTVTRGWTYDANGNRLTETGTAASTYAIAATNNRIIAITGALARTYGYDAVANTTSYATVAVTYNNAGRLKVLSNGSSAETAIYNALGQRIQVSGGPTGTVLYAYDEVGHVLGEYDGTGTLIEETVWLGDIPVATLRPSGSTLEIYYVHTDQLNTPRQVTRPSDNAQMWTWFSDPFGTDAANANPAGMGTFAYNLRFPGQMFDGQEGLHQNIFRDYDPAIGRYAQSDPIGLQGGVNTFAYTLQNPVSLSDRRGLDVTIVFVTLQRIAVVWEDRLEAPNLLARVPDRDQQRQIRDSRYFACLGAGDLPAPYANSVRLTGFALQVRMIIIRRLGRLPYRLCARRCLIMPLTLGLLTVAAAAF